MANDFPPETYAIIEHPLVERMHKLLKIIPSMLGEDTDFQQIDEVDDELWRILFDALNVPNGRIRADVMYALDKDDPEFVGTNIYHAYRTNSNFYNDYFDTKE